MKRLFTTIFTLMLTSGVFGQFERQNVLIEVGTGVWCPSCPVSVDILKHLKEEYSDMAVIKYHAFQDDPFETTATLDRVNFYDMTSFPSTRIDGEKVDLWNNYDSHKALIDSSLNSESDFHITSYGNPVNDGVEVTVHVEKANDVAIEAVKLFVVLTESSIPYDWFSLDEVNYVAREIAPDSDGDLLDFESGNITTKTYSLETENTWNADNMHVITFIQSAQTFQIHQADAFAMQELGLDTKQNETFLIFPNPADEFLTIKTDRQIENLRVYDLPGNLVFSERDISKSINVHHLAPGIYLLKARLKDQIITKKLRIR